MIYIVNPDKEISLQIQTLQERFGRNNYPGTMLIDDAKVIIYTNPKDIIEQARQRPGAYHILLNDPNARKTSHTQEDLRRNGMNCMVSINDLYALMGEVEKGLTGQRINAVKTIEVVPPSAIKKTEAVMTSSLGYPETFEAVRSVLGELNPAANVKETIQRLSRKFDNGPVGVRTQFVKFAFEYLRSHPESLKHGYNGHAAPELQDRSFVNIVNRQPALEFQERQIEQSAVQDSAQVQGPGLEQQDIEQSEAYFQEMIDNQYLETEQEKEMDRLIQNAAEPLPASGQNKFLEKIPYVFNPDVDLSQYIQTVTSDGKVQINGLVNDHIIGTSPAVVNMLFQISRLIKFRQEDILVLGENGSGKDLVLKVIGENSFKVGKGLNTSDKEKKIPQPLEIINIGAESDELFRSALMGHEKGAFTDAKESRKGYLRNNANSNLAIDEIGDVSPANQSTLLRVIQNREGIAVGADKPYNFDKRLFFATNKDLSNLRDDLRQRLSQGIIQVPPLRDRPEDIPLLVGYFLNKANTDYPSEKKGISAQAVKLLNHSDLKWPGNVRELQTTVMRAFMMDISNEITEKSIRASIKASEYEPQTSKLKQNYQALQEINAQYEYEVIDQTATKKEISQQLT